MKIREILMADDGKVLTNGELYGTVIYLGDGDKPENYFEIDVGEYERIMAEQADEGESGWSGQS